MVKHTPPARAHTHTHRASKLLQTFLSVTAITLPVNTIRDTRTVTTPSISGVRERGYLTSGTCDRIVELTSPRLVNYWTTVVYYLHGMAVLPGSELGAVSILPNGVWGLSFRRLVTNKNCPEYLLNKVIWRWDFAVFNAIHWINSNKWRY